MPGTNQIRHILHRSTCESTEASVGQSNRALIVFIDAVTKKRPKQIAWAFFLLVFELYMSYLRALIAAIRGSSARTKSVQEFGSGTIEKVAFGSSELMVT